MPSRYHFFHKNPSQGSLLNNLHDPNERRSQIDSPLHSPAFSPHSASASPSLHDNNNNNNNNEENYRLARTDLHPEQAQQQTYPVPGATPTRAQSQRIARPSNHTQQQPSVYHSHGGGGVGPDEKPESSYYPPPPSATEPRDNPKKRSFLSGLKSSTTSTKDPVIYNNGGSNAHKSLRHPSVRRKPQISTESNSQQRYSSSIVSSPREEEQEVGGAGRNSSRLQPAEGPPPIPAKDPQRFPQFSNPHPEPQQPDLAPSGGSISQDEVTNTLNRPELERQISASSAALEDTSRSPQQPYRPQPELQNHQPQVYLPSPESATSISNHPLLPRGAHDTLQQQYHKEISRSTSPQSFGPPSPIQPNPRTVNNFQYIQGHTTTYPSGPMAPPPSQQPPQGRNSHDVQQRQKSTLSRDSSAYQAYTQGGQEPHQPSGAPQQYRGQLDANPPGANHRPSTQTSQSNVEGRSTPPPSRSRDDLAQLDPAQLLTRHDELQDKYRKVKKYYFEKEAQLQQLQNTLAHQRLSQSRTSLDDNEYTNRFSRLDGAISNLAYNIRKEWRAIPPWLSPYINRDAASSASRGSRDASREMVAVGRACISRWLVDELLDRYFHPCLEPSISMHLKIIEKNLRRFAAPTPLEEEKEALLARISNWRLATLDGLQELLSSPQASEYNLQLTEELIGKMMANLTMDLKDPPPSDLNGGVTMIVELAVSIASNIPQESRDVFIDYFAPGTLFNEACMKVELPYPALTNPSEAISEVGGLGEKMAEDGSAAGPKDNAPGSEEITVPGGNTPVVGSAAGGSISGPSSTKELKKKSMFDKLVGGGKKVAPSPTTAHQQPPQAPQPPKEERVRFAAFMAVEVRGRSMLYKAPVYI